MIYQIPKLGGESAIIQEVEGIRMKLRHALASPNRWGGVLRRNTFARNIQGSNSIEGIHVTTEDAMAAIEGEEPADVGKEVWREITGYRRRGLRAPAARDRAFVATGWGAIMVPWTLYVC